MAAQTQPVTTTADRIIAQADAGCFPMPSMVVGKLEKGNFELGGLHFSFKQTVHGTSLKLHCSAVVGLLPYTAEQRARRTALKAILQATDLLQYARFNVDQHNYIHLEGKLDLPASHEDEDIIFALMPFYQEAHPFLQLMASQF
jgi:hypothetical protein